MKIVHNNKELPGSKTDWLITAQTMEGEDRLEEAAKIYEKLVKADAVNEHAWNRLMIIYRKLKDHKKELVAINAAIAAFENRYKKPKSAGKKLTLLSTAILKATGLSDKKGNSLYEPEPLGRWKKRKSIVLKRLKK
jgi:tetratricopeptide (TPR) repeat protein